MDTEAPLRARSSRRRERLVQVSALSVAAQSGSVEARKALKQAAARDKGLESFLFDTTPRSSTALPAVRSALSRPPRTAPSPEKLRSCSTRSTAVNPRRRPCESLMTRVSPGRSVQERVACAIAQRRQMDRLSALPETALMDSYQPRRSRAIFVCSDGVKLPYEVLGEPSLEVRSFSVVVIHDVFDTLDATKIFFRRLAVRHAGCQVLVYNYAGQAGSSFASCRLDSTTHARHLNELCCHVDKEGVMLLSSSPFLLAGIGLGFRIAAQFVELLHGDTNRSDARIRGRLSGIVGLNGFLRVDAQLAACFRAALAAFENFPPDRPDLPVSYLARFLFSDDYLARVPPRLALNIYTAVANPITLQGRLALIKGLLADTHTSLSPELPLVLLQSTQDALVSPAQADALSEKHRVRHVWSHELDPALGARGRALVRETIWMRPNHGPNAACVIWVKAGHELRQESARVVDDLFEAMVPYAEFTDDDNHYEPKQEKSSTPSRTSPETTSPTPVPAPAPPSQPRVVEASAPTPADSDGEVIQIAGGDALLLLGSVHLTLSMAHTPPDTFSSSVRAALVNDVASVLDRLGGVRVAAANIQVKSVGTNIVDLKITELSPEEATVLGNALYAKLHHPVLPTYWADHELASVVARKEVRRSTRPVVLESPRSVEIDPPPVRHDEERVVATAEQRRAGRYTDEVAPARVAIQARHCLETRAAAMQGTPGTEDREQSQRSASDQDDLPAERLRLRYGEMQRQAEVDAADAELVHASLVPEYRPPSGEAAPVLRPMPVEYKETAVPASILRRNDVVRALSSPPTTKRNQQSAPAEDEAQTIKREMASAYLIRETDLLSIIHAQHRRCRPSDPASGSRAL